MYRSRKTRNLKRILNAQSFDRGWSLHKENPNKVGPILCRIAPALNTSMPTIMLTEVSDSLPEHPGRTQGGEQMVFSTKGHFTARSGNVLHPRRSGPGEAPLFPRPHIQQSSPPARAMPTVTSPALRPPCGQRPTQTARRNDVERRAKTRVGSAMEPGSVVLVTTKRRRKKKRLAPRGSVRHGQMDKVEGGGRRPRRGRAK